MRVFFRVIILIMKKISTVFSVIARSMCSEISVEEILSFLKMAKRTAAGVFCRTAAKATNL